MRSRTLQAAHVPPSQETPVFLQSSFPLPTLTLLFLSLQKRHHLAVPMTYLLNSASFPSGSNLTLSVDKKQNTDKESSIKTAGEEMFGNKIKTDFMSILINLWQNSVCLHSANRKLAAVHFKITILEK